MHKIAVRAEDKNAWERRSPLVPEHIKKLPEEIRKNIIVQKSGRRAFDEAQYQKAGISVTDDISPAKIVFGVKEIPYSKLESGKVYIIFSHTIKGQPYNMPNLKKMMELGCSLIDYEKIADDRNRRLIFFGKFAGYAGAIETLRALGIKLAKKGLPNYLEKIKQPYEYGTLENAKSEIVKIAADLRRDWPAMCCEYDNIAVTGLGNVASGAMDILKILPHRILPASDIGLKQKANEFSITQMKISDFVKKIDGTNFDLSDYFAKPELYTADFEKYMNKIGSLINCIFWSEEYPRLITKKLLENYPLPDIIGDISCDIGGSVEITYKATLPGEPCYTYFPPDDSYVGGIDADGITVMAVDNLPAEFPIESSTAFSSVLAEFLPELVNTDFDKKYRALNLPPELKRALILHNGELTPDYKYLEEFLG